ncbi:MULTISPECIES: RsmF rRNA methyltransferase first C-terminal domain-containing protein [unclassified Streptococcus]|uniref:RsmF rRNA methyltransferase first C-terminal domain-containing protein n=1 Tax=unclassified Streptococcus TaxID=2608887 RepID=UPI00359CD00C
MTLPNDFVEKYRALLGQEADEFLASFEEPAVSAFRVNPLKEAQKRFSNPIPQTPWGYYGKISGKSAEHVTGLVYSQEPAAQMVVQVAGIKPGMCVLDLAAAPGGKSTHILSYLGNTGLLVSNEISTKRSKVLVENIERFGARNVVVTNDSADRLARIFSNYFDLIVFDGPCSGEGMFRKDPAACQYWHNEYPVTCAKLQQAILQDTIDMLAPGGRLVYSTCTWSPEENEAVVSWLLETYNFLKLVDIPKINGMSAGIEQEQTARMYSHRFRGEGQFVAVLEDTRSSERQRIKPEKTNLTKQEHQLWQDFARQHLFVELDGVLQTFGEQLYLLPRDLPALKGVKIARNGLHLGTFKKNRFEPSFALGLALKPSEVKQTVNISDEAFEDYARGLTVTLSEPLLNGWYQLVVQGNGLGFAKVVGQTIKNHFPKGLRLH